jgi:hypothetical protein
LLHIGLAFCEKGIYIIAILLSIFIFLHAYTQKPKNTFIIIIFLLNLLTNIFSSSWVRHSFLYQKVLQLISSTWDFLPQRNKVAASDPDSTFYDRDGGESPARAARAFALDRRNGWQNGLGGGG